MPLRRLSSRKRLALRALFSRGAILLESLVALTLLSLSAAGTLAAFDRLDGTYHAVHRLAAQERAVAKQTESMSEH
ncbi:hypothetical protein [Ralstonia solanacearum]|uniref:hypothetical protein n=1 Tax=Ralstonia solanacearum TaxID=305 RepID=UPI0006DC4008|nr:hypothetical protein [Ralstonia solanacearum]